MSDPLMHELALHEYLREQIIEQFPDTDEETLSDTLEGLTDLREKLAILVRSQLEDKVLSKALRARVEEMQLRLKRIDHRMERKRDLVTTVMDRAEIKKINEPDYSVSLRLGPKPLIVTEEGDIPADYWKAQPSKLDKRRLIEDLKGGEDIPGACMGNGGQTITVRTV